MLYYLVSMLHAKKVILCPRCKKQTFFESLEGTVCKGQIVVIAGSKYLKNNLRG